ncbi:MAG: DUF434 domain-containing protein [Pirellulales bacterium]|nr:DUF434 domain-containing protein [Pirellulales bacterium]
MPDRRIHRGPHPQDFELFAPAVLPRLREAACDLSWLLSRGYATASAVKLVGDRYDLTVRQRMAIGRSACSDADLVNRDARRIGPERLAGHALWIDGYNVLTTVEAALSGGVLLAARDLALRDMASMHGSYRKVTETRPALDLAARTLAEFEVDCCRWFLDRPVSNSGRLKALIEELVARGHWPWKVELVQNPDRVLIESGEVVASADSLILDHCRAWFNLGREIVQRRVPDAWIIEL